MMNGIGYSIGYIVGYSAFIILVFGIISAISAGVVLVMKNHKFI